MTFEWYKHNTHRHRTKNRHQIVCNNNTNNGPAYPCTDAHTNSPVSLSSVVRDETPNENIKRFSIAFRVSEMRVYCVCVCSAMHHVFDSLARSSSAHGSRLTSHIYPSQWLCKLLFSNNFFGVYFVFVGMSIQRSPRRIVDFHCLFEIDAFHRGRDDIWMDRRTRKTFCSSFDMLNTVDFVCVIRCMCSVPYWARSADGSDNFRPFSNF